MNLVSFINIKSCGKTALLVNYAMALSKKLPDKSIALIDLNLMTPDIAHFFNCIDEQKHQYPILLDEIFRYLSSGEEFDINTVITTIKDFPNLSIVCGARDMKDVIAKLQEHQWQYLFKQLNSFDYVLVDTSSYQNTPLFRCLLRESSKVVLVQDQDLFAAHHLANFVWDQPENIRNKFELWISRHEPNSQIKPSVIADLVGMQPNFVIPDIPRSLYIQIILKEKPFGNINGYTDYLYHIVNTWTGYENEKKERTSLLWKYWPWNRKLKHT